MKFRTVTCITAMALLVALAIPVSVAAQQIITIDAPGAGTTSTPGCLSNGSCQGTFPQQNIPAGAITGYYVDSNGVAHGFVRDAKGTITSFDAPGAGTDPNFAEGTFAFGINPAGAIAGNYCDAITCHGFLRAADGTFTSFDPPNSVFTSTGAINPAGAISGSYVDDTNFVSHGFVRDPKGTFTSFDPTGSVFTGDDSLGINPEGAITSSYLDMNLAWHGFVRDPKGTITSIDAPGAGSDFAQGTLTESINTTGTIPGIYIDTNNVVHGFVRATDGTITTFDAPGAGTASGQGTIPVSITPAGAITGYYIDASNVGHGFLRNP